MKNKFVLIALFAMLGSAFSLFADFKDDGVVPGTYGDDPAAIDGSHLLREKEQALRTMAAEAGDTLLLSRSNSAAEEARAVVGDEISISINDFYHNNSYKETFVVAGIGDHGLVLVTKEAFESFDGTKYIFDNPVGDGSTTFKRKEDHITKAQLDYMLEEFDNTIYPKDTEVFGEPKARGSEGKKVWILLHNIKDSSYYVDGQTSYVAGYFSASEDMANNKNMMHIDTYNWEDRVGKDAAKPLLYEGVFAHEFQHLIHFDRDADEPVWLDEGLADMAGYICGYGHPSRHVEHYLLEHPKTALTFWGGGLADYGASYLFALYMYEKFGKEKFISALIGEQANGIEGINKTLKAFGYDTDFDKVFTNWTIANLLDDTSYLDGQYGYETIKIGSKDSEGLTIESALKSEYKKTAYTAPFDLSSDWTGADYLPYTAQYIFFNNDDMTRFEFDGSDFEGVLPQDGSMEYYSGDKAWAWRSFYADFEIPADGATLNFHTHYAIEEGWDYGYVEVYSHETGEWYTLKAEGLTTDKLPKLQDNPSTPEEREPSTYFKKGRWHGFTGDSKGWQEVTMDLSPFAGQKISLYFTTWQDGATTLQMMYVDNISIPEINFSDSGEGETSPWTLERWELTDGKIDNNFNVVNLTTFTVPEFDDKGLEISGLEVLFYMNPLSIDHVTENGSTYIFPAPQKYGLKNIAIISNQTDHILPSDFTIKSK